MTTRLKIRTVLILGLTAMVVLGLVVVTVPAFKFQDRVRGRLQQAGLLPALLPIYSAPNAPADRVTARRLLVAELHDALAYGDHEHAAALNAVLSQEAFQRAYRALKAWENTRDPATGLLPWALAKDYREWDVNRIGANLYAHLLIASLYLDPENMALWEHILIYERETCGAMPCSIEFGTGEIIPADQDTLIRGASEYTRDGLLAVSERFGQGLWFDRMIEGAEAILNAAYVETQAGVIPANSTEVNGSQLQLLSRLYWITRDERYLEMAERIAETYLFEMIPNNGGLPADYWDFETGTPLPEDERFRPEAESESGVHAFRLSDHGGEIVSGLTELYFLERLLDRPQAGRYRQPLQNFLDTLLATGRTGEGLWVHSVDTVTHQPFDSHLSDTWGYNLSGFHTFDLAEGSDRYTDEITRTMRAVATQHSIHWEDERLDGYADTIESMLYLLPWFDIPEAHYWVDDEIEVMFLKQRADGFIEGWLLDGNFVRTTLLYGQYKSQGLTPDPWNESLRVGAAYDRTNDTLYIHLASPDRWQGRLRFDVPRHETIWGMPLEYPRVNGLPEWYVVESAATYSITNLDTGETFLYSGQELSEGLPVTLRPSPENVLNLAVSRP
ncbi:MAG: hypothetical protein ACOYZ7_09545 [Chloroflexota bacterium]